MKKRIFESVRGCLIPLSIILFIYAIPFTPRFVIRIIDGFSSVDRLTEKYHENSKYKYRIGAICRDGWKSRATGRGACSHHGGVSEWIYKEVYGKTIDECRKRAKERSWIE